MRCASDRSTELIEIISVEEWRGAAQGTMIMVATRRKHGKTFDHLLVGDDFVSARRQLAVDAPDPERMPEVNRFPSRARSHDHAPARLRKEPCSFWSMSAACALFQQLAIVFSQRGPI